MRLLRPSGNDIEAKIELEAIDEEPRQLAMKTIDASFSRNPAGDPRSVAPHPSSEGFRWLEILWSEST